MMKSEQAIVPVMRRTLQTAAQLEQFSDIDPCFQIQTPMLAYK
jgi:hypothetical protein